MKIARLSLLAALATLSAVAAPEESLKNWPSWRGPLSSGVAPLANPPVSWDENSHVKWKIPVPGEGTGSPVVWNDLVFILTAVPTGTNGSGNGAPAGSDQPQEEEKFTVLAYERSTGKLRWQDSPRVEVPHEGHHKDHGFASASAVTDGEVVIAYFGSRGLHAYDLAGKPLWHKDLGKQHTRNGFGEGSSPALHGNTVVIVWDHQGDDFIAAFDKRTGNELWRKTRTEDTNWSTPLIVEKEGHAQVVVNSSNKVRSYDLTNGDLLWEAGGQTANAIPTPVAGDDRVYVTSGFRGAAFQAITLGRKGDLTGTDAIAWTHNKNTPYVPSPLLYDSFLYFFAGNNAQLTVLDSKDGATRLDAERLDGIFGVYASPTAAAGRVYLTGRNGVVWVIKPGAKLEVLSKNKLDDNFDATPALVGNELFLRGHKYLYALSGADAVAK
ncbi:MAG TPA: PQQ-binding-like beta-propeller repeat protein [Candidatus Limnocylindria bacterium]|nr:PQQ-binding-like beta-propeller repeat protein [Candidatus Limnocylindria bacterium]